MKRILVNLGVLVVLIAIGDILVQIATRGEIRLIQLLIGSLFGFDPV